MKDIIDVIRVQRHDFLNHLQVISGLLQLNKFDRALDYIKQISYQMGHESCICHINNPDLAIRLLIEQQRAAQKGIEFEIMVSGFEDSEVPNLLIAEAIGQLLEFAIDQCQDSSDYCMLSLVGNEDTCKAELEFSKRVNAAEEILNKLPQKIQEFGVSIDYQEEESSYHVCLYIPKIRTCVAG